MGETAMSPSSSTDMTDVDMASIAEDELSEKFSVRGMITGKNSGKTKIVSIYLGSYNLFRYQRLKFHIFISDIRKFRVFESSGQRNIW